MRRLVPTRRQALALAFSLFAAPVSTSAWAQAETKQAETKLPVVASFSILGDLVRQVGGDRVALDVLVGPGADAHVYAPTPNDAKKLTLAKVVFVNGIRFEGWMDRLVRSSGTKALVVTATKGVKPLTMTERHAGHNHSASDPHAWQDVANTKLYVANIRDALIDADAAGAEGYRARAEAYLKQLDTLDADVRTGLAAIPAERRRIITTHDAFGYFGAAYNMTLISPQGVSTESEASAQDVARIIRQIRQEKVPAVFVENISDPRLAERIAGETGARIGGTLYSDSLSVAGGPASTYIEMMRHNLGELVKALKP
ncbi:MULTISPECIES: metal ABC transporter substrate-binding protein [unclassified Beijerinckia]|uniref:metal ABC transporter substrate-binding protein n=1 Tax=unclassified Beijerinckia TaxID=2638183 RepID=UPI0008975A05|nr:MULTISPECIES: metal ABC transporter substrate-binding protein [unclassified Beijerinckia]MDH7799804.1 zinc/manganese transport system substrate-binding protein [Beijerinckia sp. GAS462]SED38067.1 zinc/manganese transport system substrate-binding protein [Beijerinckia sp. 28-YEA-48]